MFTLVSYDGEWFPSPYGAIEFQIGSSWDHKGEAGGVSVPLRGYRIPNKNRFVIVNLENVFPSPYGAIEFQITVNSAKGKPSNSFPSPYGAIEFQIRAKIKNERQPERVSVPLRGYRIPNTWQLV